MSEQELCAPVSDQYRLKQFDQYRLPIDLHHQDWISIAWSGSRVAAKDCRSLEDVIVPMCQSPKIDDVLFHARRSPANDNSAPAQTVITAGPATVVRETRHIILIFCCAVAILLL
jgi:hypothetical protein